MTVSESMFDVVPAETEWTQKCIVIQEGARPALLEIIRAAAQNEAKIDNSDDEAGDDLYAVKFPGRDQELLDYDSIAARLRELLNPGEDDE